MAGREDDDCGYPDFERRRTPHRYELYEHFDKKIEGLERRLAAIEDKFKEASGAARLLRWAFSAALAAWGLVLWAREYLKL